MGSRFNLLSSKRGRLAGFFTLYLCEGLPQGFTATAVALEFKRMGMPGTAIGTFAATIMLPWTWKWILGPFVDNFHLRRFGRRKQWIVLAQLGMLATLVAALMLFPKALPGADGVVSFAGLALFTGVLLAHNVFAAGQDVAIDALACDTLGEEERGLANGLMFAGAQVGAMIGGSGVLYLKGTFGFFAASWLAPVLLIGVVVMVVLLLSERTQAEDEIEGGVAPRRSFGGVCTDILVYLKDVLWVFFRTRRGFLGLIVALLPTGGMALSLTVSTVLTPTLGMNDKEIADLGVVTSLIFTVFCMIGGFLSDRFGRRITLSLFALGTLLPTLWMGWRLNQEGWLIPLSASADGTWPRHDALIYSWWVAGIIFSVFNGLLYGIRTAFFMDIVEPRIAATHFTACMALLNLSTVLSYWWQGHAVTPIGKDGGWGWTYPMIFCVDAAIGCLFVFILPFVKPRHQAVEAERPPSGPEPI